MTAVKPLPVADLIDARELVKLFREEFPDVYRWALVPDPKQGGTFLYCTQIVERNVPKVDKLGRKTRYTATETGECGKKFRILKRYRRHYRRFHAEP